MDMLSAWDKGELDLYRINFSLLTLVPKELDATSIEMFTHIALINYSSRIFSKCASNRFSPICDDLSAQNQTSFLKGRYIVKNIVVAHEIVHDAMIIKFMVLFLSLIMKKLMIESVRNSS